MPIYYIYIKNDHIHLRKSANPSVEGQLTQDEAKEIQNLSMRMCIITDSIVDADTELKEIEAKLKSNENVEKTVSLAGQKGYTFLPKNNKNIDELLDEMQEALQNLKHIWAGTSQKAATTILPSLEKKDSPATGPPLVEKREKKIEFTANNPQESLTSNVFSFDFEKKSMLAEEHTEFDLFMRSKLERAESANYILIGEDHSNSSALVAVANCISEIKSTQRQVLVFSESLKSLYKGRRMTPYTLEDIEANILTDAREENLAVRILICNGVRLYGLENNSTSPFFSWESYSKEKIYEEYKKIEHTVTVGVSPEVKRRAEISFKDKGIKAEMFLLVLNGIYAASDARIVIPNEEFTNQIVYISGQFKNPLAIFTGGATHIPLVSTFSRNIIDRGMLQRVSERKLEVDACFVNDVPMPSGETGYTPKDSSAICSPILKRFKIASEVMDQKPLSFYKSIQDHIEQDNLALLNSTITQLTLSIDKSSTAKEIKQLLLLKELRNNYELDKLEFKRSNARGKKLPSLREIAITLKIKNKKIVTGVARDLLDKIIYPNYLLSLNQAIASSPLHTNFPHEEKKEEKDKISIPSSTDISFQSTKPNNSSSSKEDGNNSKSSSSSQSDDFSSFNAKENETQLSPLSTTSSTDSQENKQIIKIKQIKNSIQHFKDDCEKHIYMGQECWKEYKYLCDRGVSEDIISRLLSKADEHDKKAQEAKETIQLLQKKLYQEINVLRHMQFQSERKIGKHDDYGKQKNKEEKTAEGRDSIAFSSIYNLFSKNKNPERRKSESDLKKAPLKNPISRRGSGGLL